MDKIIINIKDKSKAHIVVELLKELSFIEFREIGKANKSGFNYQKRYDFWIL